MVYDFEIIYLYNILHYLTIYLFVQMWDIFSRIDFESDLNYLFGSFNILIVIQLYAFNDPDAWK